MLKQYSILTLCLSELRASNLAAMSKLKLEIELLQIKRIILNAGVESRVKNDPGSELDFTHLHDRFNELRFDKTVELEELNTMLFKIKKDLISHLEKK